MRRWLKPRICGNRRKAKFSRLCHPERSEGSAYCGELQIPRSARDDNLERDVVCPQYAAEARHHTSGVRKEWAGSAAVHVVSAPHSRKDSEKAARSGSART